MIDIEVPVCDADADDAEATWWPLPLTTDVDSETTLWKALLDDVENDDDVAADEADEIIVDVFIVDVDVDDELDENV